MPPVDDPNLKTAILRPLRRIVSFGLVAGYVDAMGFLDLGRLYPAAMTGNSIQLGISLQHQAWAQFQAVAGVVAAFFCGGILSSLVRRVLPLPALELCIMAGLLLVANFVHGNPALELQLLAMAMAMQGETISRFGGLALQTIVITNNLLKCADALVARYLCPPAPDDDVSPAPRPTMAEVLLPGMAWVSYVSGAVVGASASAWKLMLWPPAGLLLVTALDLLVERRRDRG